MYDEIFDDALNGGIPHGCATDPRTCSCFAW